MSQKLFKQPMLSFLILGFHRNMGSINSITHDAHPSFFSQPIFIRADSFDGTLHGTTVSSRSVLLVTLRKYGRKFPIPMKTFPARKP